MTIPVNMNFDAPADPWTLFGAWFAEAQQHEVNDPNAMSVATVDEGGMPAVRILLMKDYSPEGVVFYTNRASRKGTQLTAHPVAALCFHWKSLRRQVRFEGHIECVSDAESDAYFASRPRGSQIGAWASQQSQPLDQRATLEARVRELTTAYEGKPVPRPPHWGGYLLRPTRVEFWQDREFRLHDRFDYRRDTPSGTWHLERLYP